jgi:hypothetical protein
MLRIVTVSAFVYASWDVSAAELLQGRCHMDVCNWFSIEDRDIVKATPSGALTRVTIKWWTSHHPGGRYNRRTRRTGGEPQEGYVFCSKSKPATMWFDKDRRNWVVHHLAPGYTSALYGMHVSSYIEYFAVCHGVSVSETGLYDESVRLARKFGYEAKPPNEGQVEVKHPEDILR